MKLDQCDELDDPSAAGVGSMARARDVYIWNAKLSDTRMVALCRWPRVKSLVLAEDSGSPTPVTERGFRRWATSAPSKP